MPCKKQCNAIECKTGSLPQVQYLNSNPCCGKMARSCFWPQQQTPIITITLLHIIILIKAANFLVIIKRLHCILDILSSLSKLVNEYSSNYQAFQHNQTKKNSP
jgi:hypothetical protein